MSLRSTIVTAFDLLPTLERRNMNVDEHSECNKILFFKKMFLLPVLMWSVYSYFSSAPFFEVPFVLLIVLGGGVLKLTVF